MDRREFLKYIGLGVTTIILEGVGAFGESNHNVSESVHSRIRSQLKNDIESIVKSLQNNYDEFNKTNVTCSDNSNLLLHSFKRDNLQYGVRPVNITYIIGLKNNEEVGKLLVTKCYPTDKLTSGWNIIDTNADGLDNRTKNSSPYKLPPVELLEAGIIYVPTLYNYPKGIPNNERELNIIEPLSARRNRKSGEIFKDNSMPGGVDIRIEDCIFTSQYPPQKLVNMEIEYADTLCSLIKTGQLQKTGKMKITEGRDYSEGDISNK